jgi:hypothetical protein
MVLDAPDEESMGFIFLSAKHTDPVGNQPNWRKQDFAIAIVLHLKKGLDCCQDHER